MVNPPLESTNPYPHTGAFVLRLHRDADLLHGVLRGRIEHVASGMRGEFGDAAQLLGWLVAGLEWAADDGKTPAP
jgi:hypothetical protein